MELEQPLFSQRIRLVRALQDAGYEPDNTNFDELVGYVERMAAEAATARRSAVLDCARYFRGKGMFGTSRALLEAMLDEVPDEFLPPIERSYKPE